MIYILNISINWLYCILTVHIHIFDIICCTCVLLEVETCRKHIDWQVIIYYSLRSLLHHILRNVSDIHLSYEKPLLDPEFSYRLWSGNIGRYIEIHISRTHTHTHTHFPLSIASPYDEASKKYVWINKCDIIRSIPMMPVISTRTRND
jgi:hypothetical protein